jgi:hypothetical protein
MGRRPRLRLAFLPCLLLPLFGCQKEPDPPPPETTGGFLFDSPWQYQSTEFVTTGAESVPFPTDRALLASISYPNGDAPPTGDALYGSLILFGADRRVLMQPPGIDDYADFGTRFSIVDASNLRLKIDTGLWFSWSYHDDRASGVLLLDPEPNAGGAAVDFMSDALNRVLVSGAPDSAASKLTDALFADPRVNAAVADLLWSGINGDASAPDPAAGASFIIDVVTPSGILDSKLDRDTLVARIVPVVSDLLRLERDKLTDALVSGLLDANVIDSAVAQDRVENVVRFALYRRVLSSPQNLAAIDNVELELDRADGS